MSKSERKPLPISPHTPLPYSGPPREEVLALRAQYLTPGLVTYYREPLLIAEGKGQYVWDETGKQYLDGFAGVCTVIAGHCHPAIVDAVTKQLGTLQHTTTLYVHPAVGQLGKMLADKMPDGSNLTATYFTNCGSEANELAVLMAREHTGAAEVISVRGGYHGGTQGAMSLVAVGTWKFPSMPVYQVRHAMPGYCYRCPLGLTYPSCELKCARDLENLIQSETSGKVAAFIAEPLQGVGGVVQPPSEYFQIAYEIIRKYGGLCISDEVQTGLGRTGDHFWGFENYGVMPDFVTLAKGLANGSPAGACITRPEISQVMKRRTHFNTFGGNPITMTQGLATLEVIDAEGLQENARVVGGFLKEGLLALAQKHAVIGDVRGLGLMLGVELVKDRQSKDPAADFTKEVMERAKERGLLIGRGGLYGNVLRIKPPLCITKADAEFMLSCLDEVFSMGP
jgi:alanine-glyoxylate transaminase/(R)-3-amino-2-methylpropionate-pyruvate transaminase